MTIDTTRARPVLEGVFGEYIAIKGLPSCAWGLVDHGNLVCAESPDAVYRIASMTKSFTCAAVLVLRDQGLLALDDPIARHVPEFGHLGGPTRDSPPLTIRLLMTMGAGLATDDPWADRHLDVADDELDRWLAAGVTFAVAPDTAFEYSNLGFGILGRVVQRASGRRLRDVVCDRLLEPLGMAATPWDAPDTAVAGFRIDGGDEPLLGDGAIAPMGGLFTTVADLTRWVGFMTDAWPPRDDPDDGPLSRASRREMQRIQRGFPPRTVQARDGRTRTITGGYGFGLNVVHHETLGWVVSHSGGLPGFGSNMRWIPSTGVGLIALANQTYAEMAEATAAALDALAAHGLLGPAPVPIAPALDAAGRALVALHNAWDDETARALFADNVELDDSFEHRVSVARPLLDDHGPFRFARIEADHAAAGAVVAHGDGCELRIEFQLHPLVPARVQWYEATLTS